MNSFHCIGRLVADPEVRTFNSGAKKVSLRLAINGRSFKNKDTGEYETKVAFVDFAAWEKRADAIEKHFKKGDVIVVPDASIEQENWEDKATGQRRSKLVFTINRFEFPPPMGNKNRDKSEGQPRRERRNQSVNDESQDLAPVSGDDSEISF